MKHISMYAAMLLVVGTLLLPGCDESKEISGMDLLAMKYIANSKYYLRFDVDYDNDGTADEHVDMRVDRNFYNLPGYRYQAEFVNGNGRIYIDLLNETTGPVIYTDKTCNFSFYWDIRKNASDYFTQAGYDFEFNITDWDTSQRIIRAQFSGEIVAYTPEGEDIFAITNGELFARVVHYYHE